MGPDLLRPDFEGTAGKLTRCYNRFWEAERWPKVWKKGLIVKIFKKETSYKKLSFISFASLSN